ncbi:ATP-dependent DNA helicase RecG [Arcanobacterium haemolyticum]|nr:ATP-dependent DNA helicase RecG [Arcanobacterium haemolyticum]
MSAVASDEWTSLSRPLERALGKRTANALGTLGLHTVGDLVYHFPFRLGHRGELMPIARASEGEAVTVIARVMSSNLRPMNARRGFILTVRIADGDNELSLTFFGKSMRPLQYHERRLEPGVIATFSGKVSSYRGELQLSHPDYDILDDSDFDDAEKIAALARPIPIYHATEKLPSWHIQRAIATILPSLTEDDVPDPLPEEYRRVHGLPTKLEAIRTCHEPESDEAWRLAAQRVKHEEAFVLQTALATQSAQAKSSRVQAFPRKTGGILAAFDERLPYTLTAGQRGVGEEIAAELAADRPMQRLLQGDVGSGKTVVALRAMLQVVDGGGQAALLVPTEVLAWQHYATLTNLLGPLAMAGQLGGDDVATRVDILTGSLPASRRRQVLARMASGEAGIIIGTHALLSDGVQIPFLGLAVIDEQHRFGVDQRDSLASGVHTLVMTATPIPRTIAMSVFGDLDVSALRELPAGRQPIQTTLVPATNLRWMERVWERTREEITAGGRVFVVCPRIDSNETPDSRDEEQYSEPTDELDLGALPSTATKLHSAIEMADELASRFPDLSVGILHGRMSPEAKADAMAHFVDGTTPILVATTVIEVGVDVPDATLMVILDAERFGLSQLHQLRGRIGRGTRPGLCLAVTHARPGTLAMERVEAFASTTDGFDLAERDLELRSEGDVLGASQSGATSHLHFLSVTTDTTIIETAREAAKKLVESDPSLGSYPSLAHAVARIDADRAEYLEKG